MDIKSCQNCGRLFQFRGTYICPECVHEIDEKFVNVRNYMYKNPTATIEAICEENDVTPDMVMTWLREGRLMVAGNSTPLLECKSCGKPILTGRLCAGCADSLASKVDSTSKDMIKDMQRKKEAAERIQGFHSDRY